MNSKRDTTNRNSLRMNSIDEKNHANIELATVEIQSLAARGGSGGQLPPGASGRERQKRVVKIVLMEPVKGEGRQRRSQGCSVICSQAEKGRSMDAHTLRTSRGDKYTFAPGRQKPRTAT
jgi:hypothetical protein